MSNPGSLNRYAYVGGDPVNRSDPRGLDWIYSGGGQWCSTLDPAGGCYDPDGDDGGIDDGPLYAGSSNPCDTQSAIFNPSAAVMGCMQYYAPIIPVAAPSPSQCPLIGITGDYILNPNSKNPIHAVFQPQMAADLDEAIYILNLDDIVPVINSGFRTWSENMSNSNSPNGWSKYSNHLVGLAVDIQFTNSSLTNATIIDVMEAAGLYWGGNFSTPDRPHFQLPPPGNNPSITQIAACQMSFANQYGQ